MRRKRWHSRPTPRRLRLMLFFLVGLLGVAVCAIIILYVFLRPQNRERSEIYRGVYLTVEDIPEEFGEGKVMIAEIHWDEPGVELFFRPFFPQASGKMHYSLLPADYLRWKYDLSILVNTTRYYPGEWWKSYPLRRVNSLETLVWEGRVSHIHPLSYMFGWDTDENFLYEFSKPPSPEFLETLRWGIGVQSITINDGQIRLGAMDRNEIRDSRTFLGVDPVRKVLWLIVGEKL